MNESFLHQAYDNLDLYVYIIDATTYEILYLNGGIRLRFPDVTLGQLCYKAFCGFDTPCDYCPSLDRISETEGNGVAVKTSHYNPLLKAHFDVYERIIDWEDDRKARVCIAIPTKLDMQRTTAWQRTILENTEDFLACYDLEYNVLYCNPAMSRLTGWSVGNKAMGKFLSEESREIVYGQASQAVFSGEVWAGEIMAKSIDGVMIPTFTRLSPITDANGKVVGMASTMHDISSSRALLDATRKNLHHQEFLSKFSVPFTQLYDFDEVIANALHDLQSYLGTDRTCLYEYGEDNTLKCTFESRKNEGVPSHLGKTFTYDQLELLIKRIEEHTYLYCQDASQLTREFPYIPSETKSICYIPMISEGSSIGYLVFTCVNQPANWAEEEFRIASMASTILMGAYATHRHQEDMRRAKVDWLH